MRPTVSSPVRIFGWGRRSGTVISMTAPPFQRRMRAACGSGASRRTVMFTFSSRVRSTLLAVLVGSGRRVPDEFEVVAERQDRCPLAGGEGPGGAFSRRESSAAASDCARSARSHSASRPRATSRLSGGRAR